MEEKIKRNFWWLLPLALSGALYLNSIKGIFFWDDRGIILENPAVKQWSSSLATFKPAYWLTEHPGSKGQYRPLRNLTFTLDYSIWRNRAVGYHLTNFLLNLLAVFLLCLAARTLFASDLAAALCGLVFAFHPMHAETVNFIKNRSDMLCLIFLLASLYGFLKNKKGLSLSAYVLALLSKELAVAFPLVLLLLPGKERGWKAVGRTLPYFCLAGCLVFLKLVFLSVPSGSQLVDPAIAGVGTIRVVLSTYTQYFGLLFFPFRLELDRQLSVLGGLFSPSLIFFVIFWAAVLWLILRRRDEAGRIWLFSAAWIFLFLGPVSNLIPLTARLVAEQRLYVPSAGVALLLGGAFAEVYRRSGAYGKYLGAPLAALLLFFGYKIVSRNALWSNELLLWAQAVRENPSNMRAYDNLASSFMRAGDYEGAERIYRKMLPRFSGESSMYTNLGVIAQARGDTKSAIGFFEEAARLAPGNADICMNLGSMYFLTGNREKARELYLKTVGLNPRLPGVYTNLGVLAAGENKPREAAAYFRKAVELNPDLIEARLNLANAYRALGLLHESEMERREAQLRMSGGAVAPAYNPSVAFKGAP